MTSVVRRAISVRGTVQGVGFRPFVFGLARRNGLAGFVRNVAGDVEIEVEGHGERVAAFVEGLRREAPPLAVIEAICEDARPPAGAAAPFAIEDSALREGGARAVAPDAATCADCLRELFDPADRRFRYPFLNCTQCGPRFTIIDDLPYDRGRTSMAAFPLCARCRREYEDPRDRRFHAEPVACADCGPSLRLVAGAAAARGEEALRAAERLLGAGRIVAVKGLGGFHLACDAADEDAVVRLRARKRRPAKPLAVMVEDLEAARRLAHVSDAEAASLASRERPIVLVARRDDARLAPSVAPGLRAVGLMLPSTPLHHLLLRDLGRPLVMTSGNAAEEPIAVADDDALARLGAIADGLLLHDREIRARYDDSVVRVLGGAPVPLRRARGLAPRALELALEAAAPVLAVGAHQKATLCLVSGRRAWLSQHVGDLENEETLDAWREALARLRRLFRVEPRAIAHDLHPEYASTHEAAALAREASLPLVPVQHHHAHLASCLAERRRAGPVVGLVFDGTGLGSDGTLWGGEVLVGDLRGFERCGHLEPARLPGGERAIRRPGRMALAHLLAAAPGREDLLAHAARGLSPDEARVARRQVETGLCAPWTTSVGRLFDAAGALLGLGPEARYEGELACRLEALAVGSGAPLPVELDGEGTAARPVILRAGPALVALAERSRRGEAPRALAAAFHDAVADLACEAAARVARAHGLSTVALTGGCFQNARLHRACRERLAARGLEALVHRQVPPNDGGVALGQAAVAAARGG